MRQSKNPNLKHLCFRIKGLLRKLEAWSIRHIDRSKDEEAHNAAQEMITEIFVIKADESQQWIICLVGQRLGQ